MAPKKRDAKSPDERVWALNPFTKKPMQVKRTAIEDIDMVSEAMRLAGYDPATGNPLE